jgi:hypothetical protein
MKTPPVQGADGVTDAIENHRAHGSMPLRPLIRFNFFLINCFFFVGAIFCATTMSGFLLWRCSWMRYPVSSVSPRTVWVPTGLLPFFPEVFLSQAFLDFGAVRQFSFGPRVPLCGGFRVPLEGLVNVLRGSQPLFMHFTEKILGVRIAFHGQGKLNPEQPFIGIVETSRTRRHACRRQEQHQ